MTDDLFTPDIEADRQRLLAAGYTLVADYSGLQMWRSPCGRWCGQEADALRRLEEQQS